MKPTGEVAITIQILVKYIGVDFTDLLLSFIKGK